MIVRETARLRLRHATPGDAAFLLQQMNEPGWLANIGDRSVHSLADAEAYIRDKILPPYEALGYGMYLAASRTTGEPVGLCGLVKRDSLPDPDLGFALLQRHWGCGYAVEAGAAVLAYAWDELGLERLLAITTPGNARSGRVLTKLGFAQQPEGHRTPAGEDLKLFLVTPRDSRHGSIPGALPAA